MIGEAGEKCTDGFFIPEDAASRGGGEFLLVDASYSCEVDERALDECNLLTMASAFSLEPAWK